MREIFNRIARWFVYLAAASVMLLAVLVGIARLFLPLIPEYQGEIRRWAGAATGLVIEFQHISASWPLAGPELQIYDVTINSPVVDEPLLQAGQVTVGISLLSLIRDRQIALSRIGVRNTSASIERLADGSFLFQGQPLADLWQFKSNPDTGLELPDIRINLSDIGLTYLTAGGNADAMSFKLEQLEVRLSDTALAMDGEIQLAEQFGSHADFSLDLPIELMNAGFQADRLGADEARIWNAYISGEDLHVDQILRHVLNMEVPLRRAEGNVVVWAKMLGLGVDSVSVELDLVDVDLIGPADPMVYDSINGQIEWGRIDEGWVLAGNGLEVTYNQRVSPTADFTVKWEPEPLTDSRRIAASAGFLRLHDFYPLILAVATQDVRDAILPRAIRGDISDLEFALRTGDQRAPEYGVNAVFDGLEFTDSSGTRSLSGISGRLSADQDGGRVQVDSNGATFFLADLFAAPLSTDHIDGFLVWRITSEKVRVLSDNIRISSAALDVSSRFELSFTKGNDVPFVDLTATVTSPDVHAVLQFLPARKLSPKVVDWLDRAVVAGRVTNGEVRFRGVLSDFPFDRSDGEFRIALDVEDGILDYAPRWPRVEKLAGEIVFEGPGLKTARNQGVVGGLKIRNYDIRIPNLREGLLEISGTDQVTLDGVLNFLSESPVADAVGPTFAKIQGDGALTTRLKLKIPIKRPAEYDLRVELLADNATLGLEGLGFGLSKISGVVEVENTRFYATGVQAELLDEPVNVTLRPATEPGSPYRQFATVRGKTPVGRWIDTLSLPFPDRFEGELDWHAMALFPQMGGESDSTVHILARSEVVGVESRMPEPLAKDANDYHPIEVDIAFPADKVIELSGHSRRDLTWAMRLESVDDGWQVERGAVHAGLVPALMPTIPGVEISGRLDFIRFDDWLGLQTDESEADWQKIYRTAELKVDRLSLFGQIFPDVDLFAKRGETEWSFDFDGPNLAGQVVVPHEFTGDRHVEVDVQRLWLLEGDPRETEDPDPRSVVPVEIAAEDFVIGSMKFGSLSASLKKVAGGVVLDPFQTTHPAFQVNGDGAWLVHPNDDSLRQSRLHLLLEGTDINATLISLGYDPVIEGDLLRAEGNVTWLGSPSRDFLQRADGEFRVQMEEGALLDLEPGGGRILGVVSIAALPRRLSLDFRDVFDDGLSFDTLQGDFTFDDGNAYTCNLSLEGSVADMGVVGRAGIAAEDYDQIAVVRPHVSNLFALGGTVVGGPGVGAAMLLFSQIFRKPLSTLGESYYRVSGAWTDPAVRQIRGNELDVTLLRNCEAYLADSVTESLKE